MKAIGGAFVLLLLAAVIVSAIGVVWTRHESRTLFVQWSKLRNESDDLNIEYGRLELEQATFAEPRVIDQQARQKLGMVAPRPQDIQLVRE